MNYADRLHAAVEVKESAVLVGLDPHLALLPEEFSTARDPGASRADRARAIGDFLCETIDVVADLVPAVKPQSAFFEVFGADGAREWERVAIAAHDAGLLVIGDVKRGDIGSTAAAYATAYLGGAPGADERSACDAITVNPYLGTDAIEPLLAACAEHGAGLYVLVRTSNPSSAEFQAWGDPPLAERVATSVVHWGDGLVGECGFSSVGAVIGATHPDELASMRQLMPRTPFLLPGYGAQGAGAADVVGGFAPGTAGALVNSSRGILYAYKGREGTHWKDATREATLEMSREIARAISP